MATVHDVELLDIIVDGGESGKSLCRPGIDRLLGMVDRREIRVVIIAKLDRLTRSVRDLGELLERFQRRGVALVSVGESLDTSSAAGRLVLNGGAGGSLIPHASAVGPLVITMIETPFGTAPMTLARGAD